MANLPETEAAVDTLTITFSDGVYQFELTDPVEGGADGTDNRPTKTLANRTLYLLRRLFEKAPINSPTLTGTPKAPTPVSSDNSTRIATTAWAKALLNLKANLNSPTLTGAPKAPTPTSGDNSTRIATTAWIRNFFSSQPSAASGRQKISTSLSVNQSRTASMSYTPPASGYLIVTGVLNVSSAHTGLGLTNTLTINGVTQDSDQTQGSQVARARLLVSANTQYSMQQVVQNAESGSSNPFSMILDYQYIPL